MELGAVLMNKQAQTKIGELQGMNMESSPLAENVLMFTINSVNNENIRLKLQIFVERAMQKGC